MKKNATIDKTARNGFCLVSGSSFNLSTQYEKATMMGYVNSGHCFVNIVSRLVSYLPLTMDVDDVLNGGKTVD